MNVVNEKSTAYLTVTHLDKTKAQAAPSSFRYRIDCTTTGEQVRDWTAATAAAQIEISLTLEDNTIRAPDVNAQEVRRVTVEATYGASDKATGQYEYAVQNLGGIS